MPFFTSVANVINLIIENWLISVIALYIFASLCLGIFKGAKHGIRMIVVLIVIAIIAVCAFLVYYFVEKDLDGLIKFGIAWLPTIVFLIGVIVYTLWGAKRGLRKSLILFLHSVIVAGICIGVYFFCISSPVVDKFMLDFANLFLGRSGLQNELGVSSESETLKEVLLEYFNTFFVEQNEISILLTANSAYVLTLINMIYRIAFAIILFIVYQILIFIMYLIYQIFYPERRYKKKRNIRFALNETDSSYKRRPVGGGCVGMVRGLFAGIISLSFLGSILFVATGGVNASRLPENVDFGNEEIVSVYRSIESYGDQGIFKVLNAIRDPEDTPYYLYAADIVFSGGLDDDLHGVSGNIKFRKELGAYTGFAKDTFALLMKYGEEELTPIMQGEGGDDSMDKILNVCLKPEFRVEFDNLIDNFDQQTYVINFALSLADAVIANIDDMSFMSDVSADNKELLQVMFKRGYLCSTIPDERELIGTAVEDLSEIPPHLTINHLFTKKDAQIVLDIVLSILAGEIDVDEPLTVARNLIPQLEDLSILSTGRSEEMDPVLCRMYCYFDNKYLTDEGQDGITYASVKSENVRWTNEIRALLHVSDAIFTIYDHVSEGGDFLTSVVSIFDEENENYAENVKAYEELTEVVSDSALIGKVLNSGKVRSLLQEQLSKVGGEVYFPETVTYENKYDGEGNVRNGELYHLLRGLRLLADKSNKEIVDALLDNSTEFSDIARKLSATITAEDPNAPGNTLSSYLTESVILRSVLSTVILERAGDVLVVPTVSLELDGNNQTVKLINAREIREIFDSFPQLVDFIIPLAESGLNAETVNNLLKNDAFISLLDSGNRIAEATAGKALTRQFMGNDTVIIPFSYYEAESWISESPENPGELRRLLNSVDILGFDVQKLMTGEEILDDRIFDTLKNLDGAKVEEMFSSDVFHYSISGVLDDDERQFGFGDFDIIIPASACTELKDDTLNRVIRKSELVSLFMDLKEFGISSDTTNEYILNKLVEQKDILDSSIIISASVVNFIVDDGNDIAAVLDIPQNYKDAGSRDSLRLYERTNPWRKELPNMIGALDEIFDLSDDAFEFSSSAISNSTNELLKTLNEISYSQPKSNLTRLDVCYASDIVKNSITKELDKALTGVVADEVIETAKSEGYYTIEELRSLSETAEIFDLDILELDNGELGSKVKGEILNLTEPREGDVQRRSTLDIMYPSAIIRYFVTDELDKALCGEDKQSEDVIDLNVRDSFKQNKVYKKDEIAALVDALEPLGITDIDDGIKAENISNLKSYKDGIDDICKSGIARGIITKKIDTYLTEQIIEKAVKDKIKGNALTYSATEITNLVYAFDELGMEEFSEFETVNFKDKIKEINSAKLDVIYESNIIIGAFTKSVKDTFAEDENELVYTSKAERRDMPVLRKSEISAIVDLLGGQNLEELDVETIPMGDVRKQIEPDKNGDINSYLILANFSATLLKNRSLFVTSNVYNVNDKLVDVNEALKFIDAVIELSEGTSLKEWNVNDSLTLPAEDVRNAVLESVIMRATFTNEIMEINQNSVFKADSLEFSDRINKNGENYKVAVIDAEQLDILFTLIATGSYGESGELKVPSFGNVGAIQSEIERIDLLYDFDVTRHSMSAIILGDGLYGKIIENLYPQYIEEEDCYEFNGSSSSFARKTNEILTRECVLSVATENLELSEFNNV